MNKNIRKLNELIKSEIDRDKNLNNDTGITLELLNKNHFEQFINLYKRAYEKGDWFGNSHLNPENTIFNPEWLKSTSLNPNYNWIVFKDREKVIGATSLIYNNGTLLIDETQLDSLKGRRKGIMNTYFRRFIPLLQKNSIPLSTEFVLTPESFSLRKVLIGELNMVPIGLFPNSLYSPTQKFRKSEITSIWASHIPDKHFEIIPEVIPLYNIIAKAGGLPTKKEGKSPSPVQPTADYDSLKTHTNDFTSQKDWYNKDYRPVEFNPLENSVTFARFPSKGTESLDFLYSEPGRAESNPEKLQTNVRLLNYIKTLIKDK